jgi:hypothetical protein
MIRPEMVPEIVARMTARLRIAASLSRSALVSGSLPEPAGALDR